MEMKCPNDGEMMIKGIITNSMWIGTTLSKFQKSITRPFKKDYSFVHSYKCPKCGKIEQYSEVR